MNMPILQTPAVPPPRQERIPPLENGDRLTREEFERRYEAMPHLKKAELIEGVVYMPSPVRFEQHAEPNDQLTAWRLAYQAATPGVRGAANATVRLDPGNDVQPDGLLMIDPALGGQARISAGGYIELAPELISEISASTISMDLHDQLHG